MAAAPAVTPRWVDPAELSWREKIAAVQRACARLGASRAWVIGSAGRGTAGEESDLDVVIERDQEGRPIDRVGDFLDALDLRFPLDVVIYRPSELQGLLESGQPFLTDAWPDAKLIWEAGREVWDEVWLTALELRRERLSARRAKEDARVEAWLAEQGREGRVVFDPEATASVWWAQARSDMVSARALRGIGHYAAACFHAQQAGEKAAKAFLILTGDRRVEGHSVGVLVARASARDARFNPVQADAAFLDRFYIQTRYPDAWPGGVVPAEQYHDPEAQSALAAAERLMAVVEEILREQAGQEGNGQQHP